MENNLFKQEKPTIIFSKIIPTELKEIEQTEEELLSIFSNYQIDDVKAHHLFLCIHEHLINIFRHGFKENEIGEIKLNIKFVPTNIPKLIAWIIDNGAEFNISEKISLSQGWGLKMIVKLSDKIYQRRCKNWNVFIIQKKID